MKADVAVMIFYKASGFGSSEISSDDLYKLQAELKENYIVSSRDTGAPQSGGILDVVVEIFTNQYFKDLTEIVKDGLIFDLIFNRKKSIILKPLISAFQKIESKVECWDYTQVRFNFDDTVIVIYGAGKIFTAVVGRVFPEILKQYKYLEHKSHGFPTKISMPIQKTDWGVDAGDKWISPAGDGQVYYIEDCMTYWGLEYGSQYNRKIFDFKEKKIMDIEWD